MDETRRRLWIKLTEQPMVAVETQGGRGMEFPATLAKVSGHDFKVDARRCALATFAVTHS
jgi:hypothetical protein